MKLNQVMFQVRGLSYDKRDVIDKYKIGYIPVLRAGNIQDAKITENDLVFVPKEIVKEKQLLQYGDILIAASSGSISIVGKAAMFKNDTIVTFGAFCKVLRPDKSKIDFEYFKHFFETSYYKRTIKSLAEGANINNLKTEHFDDLEIPLPPVPQQKKIAAILDAADAYRQKTKALIAKYDELTQSLFLDMFGDPVKNEKGWEKVKMDKLMTIVRGGSPRPIDNYLGGTYPWIKIGDATKGEDIYLNKTKQHITADGLYKTRLLPKGSLIFANCGVSLGFARIINIEGCIHDGWLAFSDFDEQKLNKIFLLKALNSVTQYFRNTAPDGTQPNLNISIMKNFEIILPPILQQEKFENCLVELVAQKAQAQASLDKAEELFNSLLQRAFKGELV
jgi:type I restriction enzyme S subunit